MLLASPPHQFIGTATTLNSESPPFDLRHNIPGTKFWDPIFSERRSLNDRTFTQYISDLRSSVGYDKDVIEAFLDNSRRSVPSFEVDCIKQFCQQSSLPMNTSSSNSTHITRKAWVEHAHSDASIPKVVRRHAWMTAGQLRRALDNSVCSSIVLIPVANSEQDQLHSGSAFSGTRATSDVSDFSDALDNLHHV